ncbi:hypothetical protein T05_13950 [Trichinella murrelli]|uniref:Uncharacterized protein n=1 Tax=Trichinella murrelli TaxID=144512 RepID=A0A0V0UF27_9BILA|nr:hypothetical protein T05_13950 [Trichinella murrelli]
MMFTLKKNNKRDNRVMTNCLSKSNINVKIFSNGKDFQIHMGKRTAHCLPYSFFIGKPTA